MLVMPEMKLDVAKFRASIPPIMSGIKTGGDWIRLQLYVPEIEMKEDVKIVRMRWKVIEVKIKVIN